MKKHHVHIYLVTGLVELDIEADSEEDARDVAEGMLYNEPYSDINESDFKNRDTDYIIMTFGDKNAK